MYAAVVRMCGALRKALASFAHWTGQPPVHDPSTSTCRCTRLGLLHIDWDEAQVAQLWYTNALDLGRQACGEEDSSLVGRQCAAHWPCGYGTAMNG